MTDIAIVYNFAEHPGGGDLVALDITEALLEKGYNVHIYTSMPEGIWKAVEYFGKNSKTFEDVIIKKVEVPRLVKHPYNIYLITKKALNELKKYNLVVFFDDIPKPAQELKKVLVYVHYPHAAKILLNQLVLYRYKYTLRGKLAWKLHSVIFKQLFLMNWNNPNIYTIANSTLTYNHVVEALKPKHIVKIYPPVQVEQIMEFTRRVKGSKEDIIMYIGRIQPEKGIEDIIKAVALLKNAIVGIKIMGFNFDNNYLQYLRKLAKKLGITEQLEITLNASRWKILEALAKAKVIVHPARYEPFGIAIVEGMAAGCIPIVRKGLNGPWIDIIEEGRYGLGYERIDSITRDIEIIINEYEKIVPTIKSRAKMFSEKIFKSKIINLIKELPDT